MEIRETIITDDEFCEVDVRIVVEAIVDGKTVRTLEFGEGEPEDMTLGRDLMSAYDILPFIESVVSVTKDGEPVTYITRYASNREYYGF